jgi:hypothetical protein
MARQIQQLALELVPVGSVLAKEIRDAGGSVLLMAGCTLTESTLQSLQRRSIDTACVYVEAPADAERDAARRQQIEARLQLLLRCTGDSAASSQLKTALLEFNLERDA